MSFWKIYFKKILCNYSSLVFTSLDPDPDPYGHFWDPGSRSAWKLMRIRNTTPMWYSQITHSVRVRAAAPPLWTILLLHTPLKYLTLKHLTHKQPAQSTMLSNLDASGEPCGGACTPHLLEASCHYRVVVKSFASGQCGPIRYQVGAEVGADAYSPPKIII